MHRILLVHWGGTRDRPEECSTGMFCWRSSRIHGFGEAEGDRGAGGQVRQRSIGSLWVGAAEVAVPVHVPAGSAAATQQLVSLVLGKKDVLGTNMPPVPLAGNLANGTQSRSKIRRNVTL